MTDLLISEVEILPIKPRNGLIAFASCVINNQFYIGNIAIYSSPKSTDGYRLVYPIKTLPNGKTVHCLHPINRDAGETVTKAIIGRYKVLIDNFQQIDS